MTLPFELSEYQSRIRRTKALMTEMGLDVFLVFDPANMNYLTGYDGWSFYVPQLVVIDREREWPLWIGREMDAEGARLTTILPEDHIIGYPDHYVHSDVRHPMDFLAHELKMRELDRHEVGVDKDSFFFTPHGYECLARNLPKVTFIDVGVVVSGLRAVKSPREIAYLREAGEIMTRVMEVAYAVTRPGVRECDAVAEIKAAQIRGLPEFGGDYPAIEPIVLTGNRTGAAHLTWTDRPFEKDAVVIYELAACRHRYHAPLARTLYLGVPGRDYQALSEAVVEGLEAAMAAIRPGAACEDVEAAWRASVERHGVHKASRIGYSMGLNYPPDWGEHVMSFRAGEKTRIEAGMSFHLIPAIWKAGQGVEISESLVVTDDGCETLCRVPRAVHVKP